MAYYKVVAADDEPIMRKAMQTLVDWEALDCQLVRIASNGMEVLEELKREVPDILILDIQMPGASGIELAKYVWENKLFCQIILLTAYADFSYAQQAVKYGVLDYVIKTGALDELVQAVERAKENLEKSRVEQTLTNQPALKENFFKAVFDGTLYQADEILVRSKMAGINICGGYLVAVFHFRFRIDKKRDYTYSSLLNFFNMVFEQQLIYSVVISRDVIAVILDEIPEDYRELMQEKCREVTEMMDNFMKIYVYIGVSSRGTDIIDLKKKYDEAEYAEGDSFFNEKSKINFFGGVREQTKENLSGIEKEMELLEYSLKKGEKEAVFLAFDEILKYQKNGGGAVTSIVETGIRICAVCRKLLAEHDVKISDVMNFQESISKKIYGCRHIDEYFEIMHELLGKTADYINTAANKKALIIYECEKYIEEHYEECLTVSEISRELGVSLSYLSRIFKKATGNTIINYINEKKIEKAKEYLKYTDMKVYEIAEKLGFENTTYFSSFFKKYTSVSPKDYKET